MKATAEYMEKNFFPLPNQIFSLELCSEEFIIYSYLMYLEDRKTFQCHPSARIIGKAVGLSENTVRKYIRRLEDKGLIYTEHTKVRPRNGPPRNGNLLYTVLPIQDAVENHQERQRQKAMRRRGLQQPAPGQAHHGDGERTAARSRAVRPQEAVCAFFRFPEGESHP